MSHQSDWGYYEEPIKLPLLKVNHECEDFIPILERPSLVFYKQGQVFLYWPYSDISDALFIVVTSGLCGWFSTESSIFDNQPRNQSLWHTLTCDNGFAFSRVPFEWHESVDCRMNAVLGWWAGLLEKFSLFRFSRIIGMFAENTL